MSRKHIITIVVLVVVAGGIWVLTNYERTKKVTQLLAQLSDQDQLKAMDAMDQLKSSARLLAPRLPARLQDSNPAVRWRAVMLAAEIGDRSPQVVKDLITLVNDKDASVDRAALIACGRLKLKQAEDPLAKVVEDQNENPDVRAIAATSLGLIGSPASLELLAGPLAKRPPIPPKKKETTESTSSSAAAGTSSTSSTATATASGTTASSSTSTTSAPASTSGTAASTGTTAATTTTTEAPKPPEDKTWQLRMACAEAIGEIGGKDAVPPLAEAVRQDLEPKSDVRTAAAYALGDVGMGLTDETVLATDVRALVGAMDDESGDVRIAATMSLAKLYPPKSVLPEVAKALQAHANDDHFWERQAVQYAAKKLTISVVNPAADQGGPGNYAH